MEKYLIYRDKYIELKNQTGGVFDKKVLILCHNRKVTGTFTPLGLNNHFYGIDFNIDGTETKLFKNIFEEYKLSGTPKFETVDIIPGGTYTDDAFSDEFNAHTDDYDLVLVPDCGGPWYTLQNNITTNDEKTNDNFIH